jgi:8-oxo-dGTP pyrophosphatase MutT (NUDIX family)
MSARWKPNVTVAAVIEQDGRFLLIEEHTPEGLKLNTPAGHLDPGESPQEGAVREALEETGRLFVPDRFLGVYLARFRRQRRSSTGQSSGQMDDVTYLRLAFGGRAGERDPSRELDTGIVGTLWMTLDEVRASQHRHRSTLVLRCIEDFAAGRQYPLDVVATDPTIYEPEIK